MAQQINQSGVKVLAVDREGATVRIGETTRRMDWQTLRDAAGQEDQELARVYADVLAAAEVEAGRGALRVCVRKCLSGVGHCVVILDAASVDRTGQYRWADEGGDHHGGPATGGGYTLALQEARDIAARIGERATLET